MSVPGNKNMTREEMLEMISRLEKENEKLQKQNERKDKEISALNKRVADEKENSYYKNNENGLLDLSVPHFISLTKDLFEQFKELGFNADDFIGRSYADIFQNIIEQLGLGFLRWAADRAMLYRSSEKSGLGSSDDQKVGNKSIAEELNDVTKNGSLNLNRIRLSKAFKIISILADIEKVEDKQSVEYAMVQLAGMGTESMPQTASRRAVEGHDRKLRARAALKPKLEKETHAPAVSAEVCDVCGSDKLTALGTISDLVRTATDQIYKTFDQQLVIKRCECGNIIIDIPAQYDPPVIPSGHLGQSIIINSVVDEAHGMPENHENIELQRNFQIGNDTLPRTKAYWSMNIGKPMFDKLHEALLEQKVVMADETEYPVLQLRGQHRIPKEIRDDEEKLKEFKEKLHSKNYVELIRTPPDVDAPIVLYFFTNNRKKSTIQILISGGKIEYLVSDALYVYDSFADELNLKRQSCLVHLRREILKKSHAGSLAEELEPLSNEALKNKLDQAFKEHDSDLARACVLRGIARIYELETKACRLCGESYEQHLRKVVDARQKEAEVFDWIFRVLKSVCMQFAEPRTTKSGKTVWVKSKEHRLSTLAVYVLNHEDRFSTFLRTDEGAAAVPSHNNPTEASIRALVVLRKASSFKSSEYGMQCTCINYSLVQTAEECGIADVAKWLREYSRALYLYAFRRYCRTMIEGPQAGIPKRTTYKVHDYITGFDFEPWLPWNYVKRTQHRPA